VQKKSVGFMCSSTLMFNGSTDPAHYLSDLEIIVTGDLSDQDKWSLAYCMDLIRRMGNRTVDYSLIKKTANKCDPAPYNIAVAREEAIQLFVDSGWGDFISPDVPGDLQNAIG